MLSVRKMHIKRSLIFYIALYLIGTWIDEHGRVNLNLNLIQKICLFKYLKLTDNLNLKFKWK